MVSMKLWHGGAPGREVGDELLPPSETGLEWTNDTNGADAGIPDPNYRRDRVYATTDRDLAHAFAGSWSKNPNHTGRGCLYEVEFDEPEDDADLPHLPGVSYQAPRGRIAAVAQTNVVWQERRHLKVLARVQAAANRNAGKVTTEQ